jgi:hypothetical protein
LKWWRLCPISPSSTNAKFHTPRATNWTSSKKIQQETPVEKFLETFSEGNEEREEQMKA